MLIVVFLLMKEGCRPQPKLVKQLSINKKTLQLNVVQPVYNLKFIYLFV